MVYTILWQRHTIRIQYILIDPVREIWCLHVSYVHTVHSDYTVRCGLPTTEAPGERLGALLKGTSIKDVLVRDQTDNLCEVFSFSGRV